MLSLVCVFVRLITKIKLSLWVHIAVLCLSPDPDPGPEMNIAKINQIILEIDKLIRIIYICTRHFFLSACIYVQYIRSFVIHLKAISKT